MSPCLRLNMASLFLPLPVYLQWSIVFTWLADWKSIGNLDSAACDHALRPTFHHMLQSKVINISTPKFYYGLVFAEWIVKRKLLIRSVDITMQMFDRGGLLQELIELTGVHITSIRTDGSVKQSAKLTAALADLYLLITTHCTNLQSLLMDNIDTAEPISFVFANCKQLQHFRCRNIREKSLLALRQYRKDLVSVAISKVENDINPVNSVTAWPRLVGFSNLRSLHVPSVELEIAHVVKQFPLLEDLSASNIRASWMQLLIPGCPNMVSFSTCLSANGEKNPHNTAVELIASGWPALRRFVCRTTDYHRDTNTLSDEKILALLTGCKQLECLQVGGQAVPAWTAVPLYPLRGTQGTANRSALRMLLVDALPLPTLQTIADRCQALECVSIESCKQATTSTLDLLVSHQVHRLRLGTNFPLSDASIQSLQGLLEFHFQYPQSQAGTISPVLTLFVQRHPQLQSLVITQFPSSQYRYFPRLVQHFPSLRVLRLNAGCGDSMSESQYELLTGCVKTICPKLVQIDLPYYVASK